MANNTQAEAIVSAGTRFVTAEVTAYGDASSHLPGCFMAIVSGSEGAQTFAEVVGGAGNVAAGVQRVCIATDDVNMSAIKTAVETLDNAISGSEMQVDIVSSAAIPVTDNSGSLTVDNNGTFAVQAAQSGTWNITNVSGTVSLPTGASTLAEQQSQTTHLATIAGDTTDIEAAVELIDDAIYTDNGAFTDDVSKFALIGGVYQSSPQTITDGRVAPVLLDANGRIVVAAHAVTQSGTWNIGTVTTVTTVSTVTNVATIGTSVTPGTSAAHLGKAEDASHSSGDTGVAVLGVRRDTPAVGSDTDGDYSTFNFDSSGRLWCNVNNTVTVASHAVTNAGTFVVQENGAALTALQLIDDVVYVDDADWTATSSKHVLIGGIYQSTPGTITDGDTGPLRVDENGHLIVNTHGVANGIALGDDLSNTANVPVDDADAVIYTPTLGYAYDGATWDRLRGDATNGLLVNLGANNDVTVTGFHVDDAAFTLGTHSGVMMMGFAGTQSVDANDAAALACTTAGHQIITGGGTAGTAATGVVTVQGIASMTPILTTAQASTNTQEVVGDAAHGAAVAGNPLLVGVEGRSTAPTAVDDGDVVRALATLLGKQITYAYALPANSWSYASSAAVTDTADDEAKAAVASTRNYVTRIQVFNGHASTSTEVVIKDGSTVLWRGWAQAAGGGCSAVFDPPLRGTANTAVNVANITNSSSTYFNLQGFTATE